MFAYESFNLRTPYASTPSAKTSETTYSDESRSTPVTIAAPEATSVATIGHTGSLNTAAAPAIIAEQPQKINSGALE